jgi:hypothetical protein
MYIKLAGDYERERQVKTKVTWHIFKSEDKEEALQHAVELGWAEDKVMVKLYDDTFWVEPFEICGCPNVLSYLDYFDPSGKRIVG